MGTGNLRVRVEFDRAIGGMTYTSLKSAMPFMNGFAERMAPRMALYPLATPMRHVEEKGEG